MAKRYVFTLVITHDLNANFSLDQISKAIILKLYDEPKHKNSRQKEKEKEIGLVYHKNYSKKIKCLLFFGTKSFSWLFENWAKYGS